SCTVRRLRQKHAQDRRASARSEEALVDHKRVRLRSLSSFAIGVGCKIPRQKRLQCRGRDERGIRAPRQSARVVVRLDEYLVRIEVNAVARPAGWLVKLTLQRRDLKPH